MPGLRPGTSSTTMAPRACTESPELTPASESGDGGGPAISGLDVRGHFARPAHHRRVPYGGDHQEVRPGDHRQRGEQRVDEGLVHFGHQAQHGPALETGEHLGERAPVVALRRAEGPGRTTPRSRPPAALRPDRGGTTARTTWSKATRPGISPRGSATDVSIITASMACSTRATPSTCPAMVRPLSRRHTPLWLRSAR